MNNSRQNALGLAELLDIDLPKIKINQQGHGVDFILDGDVDELDKLRSICIYSKITLSDGIEAIADLLITAEIHCPEEINKFTRIHALSLIFELSQTLTAVDNIKWQVERSKPKSNDQA